MYPISKNCQNRKHKFLVLTKIITQNCSECRICDDLYGFTTQSTQPFFKFLISFCAWNKRSGSFRSDCQTYLAVLFPEVESSSHIGEFKEIICLSFYYKSLRDSSKGFRRFDAPATRETFIRKGTLKRSSRAPLRLHYSTVIFFKLNFRCIIAIYIEILLNEKETVQKFLLCLRSSYDRYIM